MFLLLLLWGSLAGCYQAQLNGGIAGADISLSSLRSTDLVLAQVRARDERSMIAWRGEEEWQGYNPVQKTLWMGVFYLPADAIDKEELYLVTATGGQETDHDRNLHYDAQPLPVRGQWHAILPGSEARGFRNKVSLLTEACFEWLLADQAGDLSRLSRKELLARLDFAAQSLVEDINGDGRVTYTDVLNWNNSFDRPRLTADPAVLDALNTAIVLNLPGNVRQQLALELVNGEPAAGGLGSYLRERLAGR